MNAAPSILPLAFEAVRYEAGGRVLLDGIDFELRAGPRSVILGPNGAGKSLTLRIAHGLLAPSSGRVRWAHDDPARVRRRQAMVFEKTVLLRRSVRANVEYALHLQRRPRLERQARAAEVLERLGLSGLAAQSARSLSAGEQQRLALARAWALEPELLFLDEPTAALDPSAARRVEEGIGQIAAAGTKIVMTTHDLGQARRIADEVLFLHRGALVEQAPATRFFDTPASSEAQAFLEGELTW